MQFFTAPPVLVVGVVVAAHMSLFIQFFPGVKKVSLALKTEHTKVKGGG